MILILKKILNERASRKTYHMSPVQFALQLIPPDYLTECITNWATNSSCTHRITNALHFRTHLLGHLLTRPPPLVPRNGSLKDGVRTLAINTIGRGGGGMAKEHHRRLSGDAFLPMNASWREVCEEFSTARPPVDLSEMSYLFPRERKRAFCSTNYKSLFASWFRIIVSSILNNGSM